MNVTIPEPVEPVTPGDLGDELASFVRAMRANNVSPNTILAYSGAVRQFGQSLLRQDLPTDVDIIRPMHVNQWMGELLGRNNPATAHNRWRGLQRFMNWYATKLPDASESLARTRPRFGR